jgi:hypothetical protein
MVTAVEQDGLSVVVSSCTYFGEASICLLKNLFIVWHFSFWRLDMTSNTFSQKWRYLLFVEVFEDYARIQRRSPILDIFNFWIHKGVLPRFLFPFSHPLPSTFSFPYAVPFPTLPSPHFPTLNIPLPFHTLLFPSLNPSPFSLSHP